MGTYAVLSFLYTLQAVLAAGSGEVQVPASPGSGRRRGTMVKRAVVVGSLAVGLAGITGITLAKAEAIVAYREKNGPFKSVDDLVAVQGIGKQTVKINREHMTVGALTPLKHARPRP